MELASRGFSLLAGLVSTPLLGAPLLAAPVAVEPDFVEARHGDMVTFSAFDCPDDGNGNPVVGPDGVAGTSDDLCTPKTDATWSSFGSAGTLSTTMGPTTTLTVSVPVGLLATTDQITASGPAGSANALVLARGPLVVDPERPLLDTTMSTVFGAFNCPRDSNGNPDVGPDGVAGTSDDLCTSVAASWSTTGSIGSLQSASGTTTTLDPALPVGVSVAEGEVVATVGSASTPSLVTVQNVPVGQAVVRPAVTVTTVGQEVILNAWDCPLDPQGIPEVGPDGEPGTADDLCTPAGTTSWSVGGTGGGGAALSGLASSGPIGSVFPTTGASTTFTPAALPAGTSASGVVTAAVGGSTALAGITVNGPLPVPVLGPIWIGGLTVLLVLTGARATRRA